LNGAAQKHDRNMNAMKLAFHLRRRISGFQAKPINRPHFLVPIFAAMLIAGLSLASPALTQTTTGSVAVGPSGLPVPRFVSLKSDRVNVRGGPSQNHSISWIFLRQGLPVEIIAEFENWRQIRDSDGQEGWVFHSLLSARRTILVAPWSDEEFLPLRDSQGEDGELVAKLSPGILGNLERCDDGWCRISIRQYEGWIAQDLLFGTYPNEVTN
jgi:SH3-like domain-containing protein